MGIFAKVANAAAPASRNPRLTRGKYRVAIEFFGVKKSKVGEPDYVLLEATVLETISAFDESAVPGARFSRILAVGAPSWRGQFALAEVADIVAAATGADQKSVTEEDCDVATSEGGEALKGVEVIVDAFPGEKCDADGNPYLNHRWDATPETLAAAVASE